MVQRSAHLAHMRRGCWFVPATCEFRLTPFIALPLAGTVVRGPAFESQWGRSFDFCSRVVLACSSCDPCVVEAIEDAGSGCVMVTAKEFETVLCLRYRCDLLSSGLGKPYVMFECFGLF